MMIVIIQTSPKTYYDISKTMCKEQKKNLSFSGPLFISWLPVLVAVYLSSLNGKCVLNGMYHAHLTCSELV